MPPAVRRVFLLALPCALPFLLGGCRQADGPTPTPNREQANEIGDIARDLTLWVGLTARELSERQVETLSREVKTALASTGVPENRAQSIADRLSAVQKSITANPRRWYQVF
jgi:hypothetical protein